MDNIDDMAGVNLDANEDASCSLSSDQSGSVDHNNLCYENVSGSMDAVDGHFKRITDLTADEIKALDFGSEEEAYAFYQKYAKCHGFVIRKDDMPKDGNEKLLMRQFVCNRHGLRNKKHLMRVDRK